MSLGSRVSANSRTFTEYLPQRLDGAVDVLRETLAAVTSGSARRS
jgi:hypothetical protein